MEKRSRKSKRKLNSVFMALLLTAVMLTMSTYAWFSANRVVEITGITAKVAAAEGLQISLDAKSWSSSVTVNENTLSTVASYNSYLLPNELRPVSTIGATTGDEISFYDGKVNAAGTELTGAASATRVAGTTTAATGKYIVFDVYLKNASSRVDGDQLLLGANTEVKLGATDGKLGVENTGLENSVRVGFMLFGNTAAFTAAQGDIAGLAAGTPVVSIWEPNYNQHITEVTSLDSRVGEGGDAAFKTLGLKSAGNGTLTGINGTSGTDFMAETNTVRTAGKTTAEANLTAALAAGTTTVGDNLILKPNVISKVRVYIWLEGQDPDCIDTASTGKYLDFVINLAKPAVS